MANKNDDEEEITERMIKNEDFLTEDEILKTIDMNPYKNRIENIIGKNYSYLFFDYVDNIYHSKIKNKISLPLNNFLIEPNNNDTFWMHIYKSIKFYSKENLPIFIIKYFYLKAEIEYKFIFNESKKYTNYSNKFIDIYLEKMKKANLKKINELKSKNTGIKDIFDINSKKHLYNLRNFLSKKNVLRTKLSTKKNLLFITNDEENFNKSENEEETIKKKKHKRTEIMKQIRLLKIKAIKEFEKASNIQIKQKKKYGGIKSRLLDAFNNQQNINKIINYKLSLKLRCNKTNYNNYKINEEESELFQNSQKKKSSINTSKLCYHNHCNKKKYKYYKEEKSINYKNNYYLNTLISYKIKNKTYLRNILTNDRTSYDECHKNNYENRIKMNFFSLDYNYKNNNNYSYKTSHFSNQKRNNINNLSLYIFSNNRWNIRPKSCHIEKMTETKLFIKKLEKKRNKKFLENLLIEKNKDNYNNKMYELFKKIE